MAQIFPTKLLYDIPDCSHNIWSGIVMKEEYTFAIHQCWLLLLQCILHMLELWQVQVVSDRLVHW